MGKLSAATENKAGRDLRRSVVLICPRRGEGRELIAPERCVAGRAVPGRPELSLGMHLSLQKTSSRV